MKGISLISIGLALSTYTFASPDITANTKPNVKEDPLKLEWVDKSQSPAQNFYAYANGSWQKNNPIPSDYASWGSFHMVNNQVQEIIHQLLIKASEDSSALPGSITQKVGDFYFSGMDEQSINQLGASPLQPEFDKINAVTKTDLVKEIAHLHEIGIAPFFGFSSMQDFKNSTQMIGATVQAGLSLPDRDYYLKDDPKFIKIRQALQLHIAKMFELLGDSKEKATLNAKTIMRIETQLAKASMSQVEQRDPYAVYHMMTLAELNKLSPNFSWSEYLKARGQGKLRQLNVAMPNFFKFFNEQLQSLSLDDIKTYLRWHLLDAYAPYLSQDFVNENFKMVSALSGTEKILPRWKRVVNTENGALGFDIGKLYVKENFSAQSKQLVLEIIKDIRKVLTQDLNTLPWMTQTTRQQALKKLQAMEDRVGYPDKWWDYSKLQVNRGPYVLNVINANKFLVNRDLNKIGKPIDRTEWGMTPQTINAYYDPSMNNLNLPAGILRSPFFDPKAPASVNYGTIGFVVGHEMTHGFDDQGAKFDAQGNLKNWWTPSDLKQFNQATQCIVDQFSKYVVDGNLPLQGKLVVGEATADLGGLTLA